MTKPSKFICASLPSVYRHFRYSIENNPEYLSCKTTNNFFHNTVNKYLSSVGKCISKGQKVTHKLFDNYSKLLNDMVSYPAFDNCEIVVDSAGYQVQQGYLPKSEIKPYIDLYHSQFLQNDYHNFNYAFSLDLVPGVSYSPFKNWKETIKYNKYSYQKTSDLPQHILDKMIYIHHFRTPKLNEMFKKFLFEDRLADNFKHFSTGGLVSYGGIGCPFVMYIVPLTHILYHLKQKGIKQCRWHILGGSEFKDLIFHKLVEKHVKEVHDIELEITYDSASVFMIFMRSRFTYVPIEETKSLWKLHVSTKNLGSDWRGEGPVEEVLYQKINDVIIPYNMKPLDLNENPLYREDSTMDCLIYTYAMAQMLNVYATVDRWCEELSEELYPMFQQGATKELTERLDIIMKNFNNGKFGRLIKQRSTAIINSLNILNDLDIDFCDNLVNTYLSGDEFQEFKTEAVNSFV